MEKKKVDIDINISLVNQEDFAGIVIIGGSGTHILFDNEILLNLISQFFGEGKLVAAICSAPTILANAGILKDKNATCFPGYEDKLESKGAKLTYENVTIDGNIITANGPDAASEFGTAIVNKLKEI